MRKLGFTGRLGKDGQGISQPIATKVSVSYGLFILQKRPEGLGLGANGFKEAATLKANREIAKIYNKVHTELGLQLECRNKTSARKEKDKGLVERLRRR